MRFGSASFHPVDDVRGFLGQWRRDCCRAGQTVALQQVHAQLQHLAQLGRGLHTLGQHQNVPGPRVVHQAGEELLLVRIGINAADNGDIHLDIAGGYGQQAAAVAVAAAVIVQRKDAGSSDHGAFPLQLGGIQLFFLGDLHHQLPGQFRPR